MSDDAPGRPLSAAANTGQDWRHTPGRVQMAADALVFLVDVDNTLLDNDQYQNELKAYIEKKAGTEAKDRYWTIQEGLFHTLGYRDYLGAFQQYRLERPDELDAIWLSEFVVDFAYDKLVYPGALDVLARMRAMHPTVALTDGDAVFQPRKLLRSGLAEALQRRVVICVHKDKELARVEAAFPARHYVLVDDKIRILTACKQVWGDRLTTVFVKQGQFARDLKAIAECPTPDMTVDHIGDLLDGDILARLGAAG
jgi:FMN phosphatase YigB (HAD superfamily)